MKYLYLLLLSLIFAVQPIVARQPQKGYRGFLEWNNSLTGYYYDSKEGHKTAYYTGFSTSHGYQINPVWFVGAGLSFEYCPKYSIGMIPVFVQTRADLLLDKYTPFIDARLGYNLTDGGGIYFSPTFGYRFNWGRKAGLNVGLGLILKSNAIEMYLLDFDNATLTYEGKRHYLKAYFTFRIGIDF